MLLNILQGTAQLLQQRIIWPQNVKSVAIEKPWINKLFFLDWEYIKLYPYGQINKIYYFFLMFPYDKANREHRISGFIIKFA